MSDNLSPYWNDWNSTEDLPPVNTRLYIDNLDASSSKKDILILFSTFGKVVDINIAVDRSGPNPGAFGFVTLSTVEEVRSAIRSLNGKVVEARILKVNEAYPADRNIPSQKGRRTSRDRAAQHH